MSKKGYEFNGQVATNMRELCELLGKQVTKKQVQNGEVEGVTMIDLDDSEVSDNQSTIAEAEDTVQAAVDAGDITEQEGKDLIEDTIETIEDTGEPIEVFDGQEIDPDTDSPDDTEDDTNEDDIDGDINPEPTSDLDTLRAKLREQSERIKASKPQDTGKGKGKKGKETVDGDVEYPERGGFKAEKDLKKFYKKLTDAQLDEWLALEGLTDSVKLCDHEPINRMRKCMANTVELRPVTPGQRQEGDLTVIESGVKPDETVVVTGQLALSPGAKIAPQPYAPQTPATPERTAASKSAMSYE
jgi:polyhydroxyalkanoate synthesis regulator phasin